MRKSSLQIVYLKILQRSFMNSQITFYSISDITKYIYYKFESDASLQEVYLQGEISNFKYSGKHCYFSLKDQNAEISAMFFYPHNMSLNFKPMDGMSVQVVGKIQVYQKRGTYSIVVQKMAQAGIGLLYQEFLDLKEKLQKEGLFDERKKLKIPEYPEKVAIITAATGEAVRDIISTFNRRFPLAQLKVYPALVQGRDAPQDLIRALQWVYRDNEADVIIIGRGGGSFEDLSCFNDEKLARVLFASPIPTISAVGHEGDYTICDFVASFRAPTPTGAAMKLTKEKKDVIETLVNYSKRLKTSITAKLTHDFQTWNHCIHSYGIAQFKQVIEGKYQNYMDISNRLMQLSPEKIAKRLEEQIGQHQSRLQQLLQSRIESNEWQFTHYASRLSSQMMEKIIAQQETSLEGLTDKLVILNPFQLMKKGYSIVYKQQMMITSEKELSNQDDIIIQFHDGKVKATVQK